MDLFTLAKAAGPISSGIFAGYTWSLSDAAIPAVLSAADEATKARQWRIQYLRGFLFSVPCTIINIASWAYLALNAPESSLSQTLFIIAAVGTGSGTAFAWTFLRATNGALSIRSEKLAGSWEGPFTVPLTYSRNEKGAKGLEKKLSTEELVQRWSDWNTLRSAVLIAGTIAGSVGLAML